MNNLPNMFKVAKAQKHRNTFPLDCQHLTTMDFGKTNVTYATELVPNDEFDIDVNAFVQLAPMVVPTMGKCELVSRAFFVPYRFVWKYWEDFFSQNKVAFDGTVTPSSVPSCPLTFFVSYFVSKNSGTDALVTVEDSSDTSFDLFVNSTFYRLTYRGRVIRQILEGLGYTFLAPSPSGSTAVSYDVSLLPLLALVKVFRDYYVNPNFNYTVIDQILSGVGVSDLTSMFDSIFSLISQAWFEADVFTSAWAGPENANYVAGGKFVQQVVSSGDYGDFSPTSGFVGVVKSPYTTSSTSSTPPVTKLLGNGSNEVLTSVSELGLNLLKQVRNFVLRQNIAGGRYVDQLLSRFGIKLNDNEANRSRFIGSFVSDLNISRVDATAAGSDGTFTSSLGDFTGRGTMSGNGHFHYKNGDNDFGMLIIVSHIMPRTSYFQGLKQYVTHLNFNEFFNPDLEDVGMAPIPTSAVWCDSQREDETSLNVQANAFSSTFGFAPNYWEYKSQMDYLSGDFRNRSLNSQLDSFQLMRKLVGPAGSSGSAPAGSVAVLNEQFMTLNEQAVNDYNRIFLQQGLDADHFICSFIFKIRATRPMNSLGNSILAELNEHGNDVGDLVKVRPNGKYF